MWGIITTHAEPSEEAWIKLLTLSQKGMLEYINEARARIGLPPLTSYDPAAEASKVVSTIPPVPQGGFGAGMAGLTPSATGPVRLS